MYGTNNQSKIRFQHNFDIKDSWIVSHNHDYNGNTLPPSWDDIREMQPDEVAQAATQYVQRLVSHMGEHRVNPTDAYPSNVGTGANSFLSTDAGNHQVSHDCAQCPAFGTTRDPAQRETPHHGSCKLANQSGHDRAGLIAPSSVRESQIQTIEPLIQSIESHMQPIESLTQLQLPPCHQQGETNTPNNSQQTPVEQLDTHSKPQLDPNSSANITNATKEEPTQQYFPTEAAIKAKERRNKIKEEQGISSNQQQKTLNPKRQSKITSTIVEATLVHYSSTTKHSTYTQNLKNFVNHNTNSTQLLTYKHSTDPT